MTVKDMERRLALVGSENRAEVLVELLQQTPSKKTARKLLRDWFNVCEALAPWTADFREQFERVGYVSDSEEKLDFPITVYRAAYEDDDIDNALSWTTSRATAEFFARHHTSFRAQFLGLYRDDVDMLIWQGTAHSALAYFTGRDEHEIVPGEVTDSSLLPPL